MFFTRVSVQKLENIGLSGFFLCDLRETFSDFRCSS